MNNTFASVKENMVPFYTKDQVVFKENDSPFLQGQRLNEGVRFGNVTLCQDDYAKPVVMVDGAPYPVKFNIDTKNLNVGLIHLTNDDVTIPGSRESVTGSSLTLRSISQAIDEAVELVKNNINEPIETINQCETIGDVFNTLEEHSHSFESVINVDKGSIRMYVKIDPSKQREDYTQIHFGQEEIIQSKPFLKFDSVTFKRFEKDFPDEANAYKVQTSNKLSCFNISRHSKELSQKYSTQDIVQYMLSQNPSHIYIRWNTCSGYINTYASRSDNPVVDAMKNFCGALESKISQFTFGDMSQADLLKISDDTELLEMRKKMEKHSQKVLKENKSASKSEDYIPPNHSATVWYIGEKYDVLDEEDMGRLSSVLKKDAEYKAFLLSGHRTNFSEYVENATSVGMCLSVSRFGLPANKIQDKLPDNVTLVGIKNYDNGDEARNMYRISQFFIDRSHNLRKESFVEIDIRVRKAFDLLNRYKIKEIDYQKVPEHKEMYDKYTQLIPIENLSSQDIDYDNYEISANNFLISFFRLSHPHAHWHDIHYPTLKKFDNMLQRTEEVLPLIQKKNEIERKINQTIKKYDEL